jgi:hypothetical protein
MSVGFPNYNFDSLPSEQYNEQKFGEDGQYRDSTPTSYDFTATHRQNDNELFQILEQFSPYAFINLHRQAIQSIQASNSSIAHPASNRQFHSNSNAGD